MLSQFKEQKSLTLLVSLLTLIFLFPFFEGSAVANVIFVILFTGAMLSGIYAISYDARYIAVGLLLISPVLVTQWANIVLHSKELDYLGHACTMVFMAYMLASLLDRVFKAKRIGLNEVYASICAYVLIGIVFAQVYLMIEMSFPGSFHFESGPKVNNSPTPFLFFSFSQLAGGAAEVRPLTSAGKSLALMEVLIGVIYVAVLIGYLLSAALANANKKEEDVEAQEKKEKQKVLRELRHDPVILDEKPIGVVMACIMMNFVAGALMYHFKLPFFLDSGGTSLAVLVGGWKAGVITALGYNLLIAATFWGWPSWVWVFSSLFIVFATCFFGKRGWFSLLSSGRLIAAGVLTGILNAGVTQAIGFFANLPPYQPMLPVFQFFLRTTNNATAAAIAEKMFVEIADKTISFMLAAAVVLLLQDLFNQQYKKRHEKS